jgi:hypothetical protein
VVLGTSDPTLVSALEAVCEGDQPVVLAMPPATPTIEATGRAVAAARSL